jgi:hypothetical protein
LLITISVYAALTLWSQAIGERNRALAAELQALKAREEYLARGLEEMEPLQPVFRSQLVRPRRVLAARQAVRWGEALRALSTAGGPNIQLQHVTGAVEAQRPGISQLHVEGVAMGAKPRIIADHFREQLAGTLQRDFPSAQLTIDLERLDETSAQQLAFRVSVALSFEKAAEGADETVSK